MMKVKFALLVLIGLTLWRCSPTPGKTFLCPEVHQDFLSNGEGVKFIKTKGEAPQIADLCPTLSWKRNGGYRKAFACADDFCLEIDVKEVPARAVFKTGFCVSMKAHKKRRPIAASYKIWVNQEEVAAKDIPSFSKETDQVWYDEEVVLDAFEGKPVRLRLEARVQAKGERVTRGWSEPRIEVSTPTPWRAATQQAPNIIVVLVDTLRADRLGCYGYPKPTSPNLDRLAARSMVFEKVLAPSSWTSPSTATLLTGQYPFRHGVIDYNRSILGEEKRTLAEVCLDAGLFTGAFVTNMLISKSKQFDQGFVHFSMHYLAGAKALTDAFLNWFEKAKEGRFMAYLHYIDPHYRYHPPPRFKKRFVKADEKFAANVDRSYREIARAIDTGLAAPEALSLEAKAYIQQAYDSEIAFWDHHFGRLVSALNRQGLMEKTILVVTSDHGEEFLEHGKLGHGWDLFNETVHVPLIIYGPGIHPGRCEDFADLTCVMPTVLAAAGLYGEEDADFDGVDLFSSTKEKMTYLHTEKAWHPEEKKHIPTYGVNYKNWKFLVTPDLEDRKLFNLNDDPKEQFNLLGKKENLEKARKLENQLLQWIKEQKKSLPDNESPVDDAMKKALQELGYVK